MVKKLAKKRVKKTEEVFKWKRPVPQHQLFNESYYQKILQLGFVIELMTDGDGAGFYWGLKDLYVFQLSNEALLDKPGTTQLDDEIQCLIEVQEKRLWALRDFLRNYKIK